MKLKNKICVLLLMLWLPNVLFAQDLPPKQAVADQRDKVIPQGLATDESMNEAYQAADTLDVTRTIQVRLNQILKTDLLNTSQMGLMVYDLDADSAIYRYCERQTLRPASTQKIFTAVTALDELGANYQLKTTLAITGNVSNRTLTGDIYCIGGFDPMLTDDDISVMVDSIRQLGIDTIRGYVYADKSFKDKDLLGEGWCWDDKNPTLSPLLVNKKDAFVARLMTTLRNVGIKVTGVGAEKRCPTNAKTICSRQHSLIDVMQPMMKESDNLYAEAVFYQLAAAKSGQPATAKNARAVVRQLINRIGLDPSMYRIADGCGLSLYNYVSAELEVMMLRYAFQNENIRKHFVSTLPIAAQDGTLKKRMSGTAAAGNVKAKTGTVSAVYSLAGYCTAQNGHHLCFAILNQGVLGASRAREIQDKICIALCK